jgi:hypothetical protein
MAVRVGVDATLENQHRLNYRESVAGAVFQVHVGILAIEFLKERPGRIAEPEKRLAVFRHQAATIVGDSQCGQIGPPKHTGPTGRQQDKTPNTTLLAKVHFVPL